MVSNFLTPIMPLYSNSVTSRANTLRTFGESRPRHDGEANRERTVDQDVESQRDGEDHPKRRIIPDVEQSLANGGKDSAVSFSRACIRIFDFDQTQRRDGREEREPDAPPRRRYGGGRHGQGGARTAHAARPVTRCAG